MSGAERLYTPGLLALALRLADYPWDDSLPNKGDARSKSCGSTLAVAFDLDEGGRISRLALKVRACAVGQASAAIFADAAVGRGLEDIRIARDATVRWLEGEGPLPEWPGMEAIEPARGYPGRHGAMMLPWEAVLAALSTERTSG